MNELQFCKPCGAMYADWLPECPNCGDKHNSVKKFENRQMSFPMKPSNKKVVEIVKPKIGVLKDEEVNIRTCPTNSKRITEVEFIDLDKKSQECQTPFEREADPF